MPPRPVLASSAGAPFLRYALAPRWCVENAPSDKVAEMKKCLAPRVSPWLIAPGVLLAACAALAAKPVRDAADAPRVIGWVPAYGIEQSIKALSSTPAAGQALTRIGLQF